ncbi:kinase-like protein [Aspergillus coremiiformis]|uniref:Kinase-like protein n=1 Tax=Aspergillus coremiiformis TaxID=138285 RepID=A0A5N6Z855_9EURO|nr:kinase-like protein [Aspergillus coremiiformis]
MSSTPIDSKEYIGQSGRKYRIERVLQEEAFPPRQVYVASADDQKFILKYIHTVNFDDLQAVNNRLCSNASHVRLAQDTIPEKSMFAFEYFADHLLHLAQKDLPLNTVKRILKDALLGIAEMHDRDIVHTDIKADNIFINWKSHQNEVIIERRSPEAHAQGPVNKPSDIFSFALVCIYAIHKRVIFAVGEEELEEGVDPLAIIIERQISYFADEDGLNGLLRFLGDNPWVRVFEVIRDGFNKDNPRKPFSLWKGVDEDFKSLICAMTHLDPEKRVTAHEALAHKWFDGI